MREEDLARTEELKMNHLSVEEVAARRAEVRKLRELMFRAEVKAKRVAKIKSKTYRRMKKKEREKLAAKLGEDEVDDDDEEARMKREAERALERATLRHKNTGKWAKAMKGRGELDEDQRREITEMLDRGEKLRRRIQGQQDSGDESEDESDDDGEGGLEGLKAKAFEELAELKRSDELPEAGKGKSVFDMKFMRDAATREQADLNKDVDDFMKEIGEDGVDEEDTRDDGGAVIERAGGRMSFRPGVPVRNAGNSYDGQVFMNLYTGPSSGGSLGHIQHYASVCRPSISTERYRRISRANYHDIAHSTRCAFVKFYKSAQPLARACRPPFRYRSEEERSCCWQGQ